MKIGGKQGWSCCQLRYCLLECRPLSDRFSKYSFFVGQVPCLEGSQQLSGQLKSRNVLFYVFIRTYMTSIEQIRSCYLEQLGQASQWVITFRSGSPILLNTISCEQFLPFYLLADSNRTQCKQYRIRQQYALPSTPKLIILSHTDPLNEKLLLLVQRGQYDFQNLIAHHRNQETELEFALQIIQTASMLMKKFGPFYLTPNMVRASKGPNLILWFAESEINNQPSLPCSSQSQMVEAIINMLQFNFQSLCIYSELLKGDRPLKFETILEQTSQQLKKLRRSHKNIVLHDTLYRAVQANRAKGTINYKHKQLTRNPRYNLTENFVEQSKSMHSAHNSSYSNQTSSYKFKGPSKNNSTFTKSNLTPKARDCFARNQYEMKAKNTYTTCGQLNKAERNPNRSINYTKTLNKDSSIQSFVPQHLGYLIKKGEKIKQTGNAIDRKNRKNGEHLRQWSRFKEQFKPLSKQDNLLKLHFVEQRESEMEEQRRKTMGSYIPNCWANLRSTEDLRDCTRSPIQQCISSIRKRQEEPKQNQSLPVWSMENCTETDLSVKLNQISGPEEANPKIFLGNTQNMKPINEKVRDSGNSFSTAANQHLSINSSGKRKLEDFSSSMGSNKDIGLLKLPEGTRKISIARNLEELQKMNFFCRNKNNGKFDIKVSKIIDEKNEDACGVSPRRSSRSPSILQGIFNASTVTQNSFGSPGSQFDRDVSNLFRSGAIDRISEQQSSEFAGIESELNRILFD